MDINESLEEEKHMRTLAHYLEKYHNDTGYNNKEVSDILKIDRSYYNKIRLQKASPLTNGIIILKKFAALTNENLFNFLYEIEETSPESKDKDKQWLEIVKKILLEGGPVLRRALIHKRLKNFINKNDQKSRITIIKIFTITALLLDISKSEEWIDIYLKTTLRLHEDLNLEKENDIKDLLSFVNFIKNKS
ncbi:hypothetical protein [Fluviispira sanaruensis]|uniref:Uncharacterized protein n=1 Tax=Fluviispira sanaruensis TaxID=2493639 RepID=A0A4V0P2X1_FLUSA|nr:hypothetical protein [Fluviispira sanaruensis]BBH54707.1 hypothetical protein JCM31447_31810 [Fluviispira sanaruensis]